MEPRDDGARHGHDPLHLAALQGNRLYVGEQARGRPEVSSPQGERPADGFLHQLRGGRELSRVDRLEPGLGFRPAAGGDQDLRDQRELDVRGDARGRRPPIQPGDCSRLDLLGREEPQSGPDEVDDRARRFLERPRDPGLFDDVEDVARIRRLAEIGGEDGEEVDAPVHLGERISDSPGHADRVARMLGRLGAVAEHLELRAPCQRTRELRRFG